MPYTKLDSGITESTIWQAPDHTLRVWIAMLARVDQNGYVGASIPGLAALARVSVQDCETALGTLLSPDKYSRTKEHEGRRIAEADGGWVLLNHEKYRAMQSADDRRERSRLAMAALRDRRKQKPTVNIGEQSYPKLTQAEAEAEAELKKTPSLRSVSPPGFEVLWKAYPRKIGKGAAVKAFVKLKPDGAMLTKWIDSIGRQKKSVGWTKDAGQFIPHLSTWLNGQRWEDELPFTPESSQWEAMR